MALNMKSMLREIKNLSYDPIEIKVREATANEAWGPSRSLLQELAQATYNYRLYSKLFNMLWKRLTDVEHYLHVQKALITVDYLLRTGHERFVQDVRKRARDVLRLKKYKYYNQNNEDIANDVRVKADQVYTLLTDDSKLLNERKTAEKMKDNIHGLSSDDDRSSHIARSWDTIDQLKSEVDKKESTQNNTHTEKKRVAKKVEEEEETEEQEEEDPFAEEKAKPVTKQATKSSTGKSSTPSSTATKKKTTTTTTTTTKVVKKKQQQVDPEPSAAEDDPDIVSPPAKGAQYELPDADDDEFNPRQQNNNNNQKKGNSQHHQQQQQQPTKTTASLDELFNLSNVNTTPINNNIPINNKNSGPLDLLTGSSPPTWTSNPFDTPAEQKPQKQTKPQQQQQQEKSQQQQQTQSNPDDIWALASAFTDLDNLKRDPKQKTEQKTINTGVSMGQMNELRTSMQPGTGSMGLGDPWPSSSSSSPQQQQKPKQQQKGPFDF